MRSDFPKFIILPDKIYSLSITKTNSNRAFQRDLIDYHVKGENALIPSDTWKTLLGLTLELSENYQSYNLPIPIEWILIRFLTHYVRTNSVDVISGPGGDVLYTKNFGEYLGTMTADSETENILRIVLNSWVRVFPKESVALGDIYCSTDINFDSLKRGINFLKLLGHLKEISKDTYEINPNMFINIGTGPKDISFARKYNRYYQEINIGADELFCFIITPFREVVPAEVIAVGNLWTKTLLLSQQI
ncbi:MAG: hypothetical protein ACPL1K_01300 [Candidatus Kryptoniota bacterium]